jgi:D-3-phosphoglycerate dehydrogenase
MSFRVLVPQPIAEEGLAVLRGSGLEVVQPPDTALATLQEHIADCQGVLVRTVQLTAELLGCAPSLRVVARHGAGYDNIDLDYCRSRGISATYAPHANTVAVAEHALGLLLAIAKNLRRCDIAIRRGSFDVRNTDYGIELDGKVLGVIGLGRIGQLVARRAAAGFGMRVIGFDPYVDPAALPDDVRALPFDELLATADALSVHVPLNDATRDLVGPEQFAAIKPGSYLVNCARGGVVNEQALLAALRSGKLRAAALDVFDDEPLPVTSPLVELDNVLLTPHMAAHTTESLARMAVHAAEGIVAVARGEQPRWPVPTPDPILSQRG